jgi:hypothetical protein
MGRKSSLTNTLFSTDSPACPLTVGLPSGPVRCRETGGPTGGLPHGGSGDLPNLQGVRALISCPEPRCAVYQSNVELRVVPCFATLCRSITSDTGVPETGNTALFDLGLRQLHKLSAAEPRICALVVGPGCVNGRQRPRQIDDKSKPVSVAGQPMRVVGDRTQSTGRLSLRARACCGRHEGLGEAASVRRAASVRVGACGRRHSESGRRCRGSRCCRAMSLTGLRICGSAGRTTLRDASAHPR